MEIRRDWRGIVAQRSNEINGNANDSSSMFDTNMFFVAIIIVAANFVVFFSTYLLVVIVEHLYKFTRIIFF